jgi:hypothetical protein
MWHVAGATGASPRSLEGNCLSSEVDIKYAALTLLFKS